MCLSVCLDVCAHGAEGGLKRMLYFPGAESRQCECFEWVLGTYSSKLRWETGMVVHTCNPSTEGG